MIRKKKTYKRPRQIFESERIKEENKLVETFGLKNKTEIWKANAKVDYYRGRAKVLSKKPLEEQEVLFNKLNALGIKVSSTVDVLDLKVENILDRRLPTIVAKKKLAHTVKQARQMVVHKNILINGKVLSSPSYIVSVAEEDKITIKKKAKKPKAKKEAPAEAPAKETPKEEPETKDAPVEDKQAEQPAEVKEKPKAEEETK